MELEQVDTKVVAARGTTVEKYLAEAAVNKGIVEGCVPELYYIIDELLNNEGHPIPKELKVQARKALPAWCSNSFSGKKGNTT
jgi:hypothetical protein